MKDRHFQAVFYIAMLTGIVSSNAYGANSSFQNETTFVNAESNSLQELTDIYEQHASIPSEMNEHIPVLRKLLNCISLQELFLLDNW